MKKMMSPDMLEEEKKRKGKSFETTYSFYRTDSSNIKSFGKIDASLNVKAND